MRLRCWIKDGLMIAAGSLLATALVTAYFSWVRGLGGVQEMLALSAVVAMVFGALMLMAFIGTAYTLGLPLALSFGSSRKEAMVGIQCYRFVPMVILSAAAAVLTLLGGEASALSPLQTAVWALAMGLIMSVFGMLIGIVAIRFGPKARIALVIGGAMGGGFLSGFIFALTSAEKEIVVLFNNDIAMYVALGVAAALYAVMLIPEYKTVYGCNVKL